MKQPNSISIATGDDGSIKVSTDRTWITLRADGTVELSSYDPIELKGAALAKLDDPACVGAESVKQALRKRADKKTSN